VLTSGYILKLMGSSEKSKGKGKGLFIGEKLQHLLMHAGISDRRLAREIGVSPTAVYKWKYNISGVTWEYLEKLSSFFGVPISYFLDEETDTEELYSMFGDIAQLIRKLPPEKRKKVIKTFKEQLELMSA